MFNFTGRCDDTGGSYGVSIIASKAESSGRHSLCCLWGGDTFLWVLGYRYVENMDAASSAVGRLTTEIAVLNTQMTYLREDISDLQSTVKILQDRAHKALYLVEKPRAKTYVPTTTRISSEVYFGQAWGASTGMHGFSDFAYGGFASRKSEKGGV